MPQAGRRDVDQPLGQGDGRRMRTAQQRDVGDLGQLCDNCRIELGMAMAVDVAPQAADRVEILPAVDVDQRRAVAALQDERLVLGHLGERMPHDLAIPLGELFARGSVVTGGIGQRKLLSRPWHETTGKRLPIIARTAVVGAAANRRHCRSPAAGLDQPTRDRQDLHVLVVRQRDALNVKAREWSRANE